MGAVIKSGSVTRLAGPTTNEISADDLARLYGRSQTKKKGPQITQISADFDSGCRYWSNPTFFLSA